MADVSIGLVRCFGYHGAMGQFSLVGLFGQYTFESNMNPRTQSFAILFLLRPAATFVAAVVAQSAIVVLMLPAAIVLAALGCHAEVFVVLASGPALRHLADAKMAAGRAAG